MEETDIDVGKTYFLYSQGTQFYDGQLIFGCSVNTWKILDKRSNKK